MNWLPYLDSYHLGLIHGAAIAFGVCVLWRLIGAFVRGWRNSRRAGESDK